MAHLRSIEQSPRSRLDNAPFGPRLSEACGIRSQRISGGPPPPNDPVITVIVPTRNRRGRLRDTLVALFAQDVVAPFEVIVVDNASTDGTQSELSVLAES